MLNVEFKPRPKIEDEALEWIQNYKPEYLSDLNKKIDYYDFLFEFLPDFFKESPHHSELIVSYYSGSKNHEAEKIAGYTTASEVKIDESLFDSNSDIEIKRCNWTMVHEVYHAIYHRKMLQAKQQQATLFDIGTNKEKGLTRIVSLHRDIGFDKTSKKTPVPCVQANIFAGCFMIPKQRLKAALLSSTDRDYILVPQGIPEEDFVNHIVENIMNYFDVNKQPLKIALKNYELIKQVEEVSML